MHHRSYVSLRNELGSTLKELLFSHIQFTVMFSVDTESSAEIKSIQKSVAVSLLTSLSQSIQNAATKTIFLNLVTSASHTPPLCTHFESFSAVSSLNFFALLLSLFTILSLLTSGTPTSITHFSLLCLHC